MVRPMPVRPNGFSKAFDQSKISLNKSETRVNSASSVKNVLEPGKPMMDLSEPTCTLAAPERAPSSTITYGPEALATAVNWARVETVVCVD